MASPPLSALEEEKRSHSDVDKENGSGGGNGGLPEDQVFELLTRVQLDDIPACRMVSTRWRRLTYEPAFAPLHCRRAAAVSGYLVQSVNNNCNRADFVSMHAFPKTGAISLDFLPAAHVRVEAVSAHQGLACCVDLGTARRPPCYYVCKPATRQWRALPNPRVRYRTAAVAMVAWPSATAAAAVEFKIVRFSVPTLADRLLCEVFDSRRFAWRRAPDVLLCPYSLLSTKAPAVRAHGAMHWLRWSDRVTAAQDVFAFDFRTEKHRVIPLPREVDEMEDDQWPRKKIAAVEGRLCLLVLTDPAGTVDEKVMDVWEMASYREGRWRKKMTVSLKSLHAKEGAVILGDLHSSDIVFFKSFCSVMWYDLRRGKIAEVQVKNVCIEEIFKYESDLIPCNIGSRACQSPAPNCMF